MDLGRLTTVALWMAATGCAAVLGLDEFEDATVSTTSATATGGGTSTTALTTGGGGATTSGGTTGGGGIGGSGGGMLCQPGSSQKCPYMGPMGTEGLGNCVAGHRICNVDGDG